MHTPVCGRKRVHVLVRATDKESAYGAYYHPHMVALHKNDNDKRQATNNMHARCTELNVRVFQPAVDAPIHSRAHALLCRKGKRSAFVKGYLVGIAVGVPIETAK